MRLNKKQLAALAMSAVMAASTMPFPVLAEEFTDGSEATVATQATEGVVATSISWNYVDGKGYVSFKRVNGVYSENQEAKVFDVTKADCERNGIATLGYDFNGDGTIADDEKGTAVAEAAKGHKWGEKAEYITYVEVAPTCDADGSKQAYEHCENDWNHTRRRTDLDIIIPAQHTFEGEEKISYVAVKNIKVDANGNCVLGEDGKPQLENGSKRGVYQKVVSQYCKVCKKDQEKSRTTEYIEPEEVKYYVIYNVENIDDSRVLGTASAIRPQTMTYDEYIALKADKANIGLDNCTKDGKIEAQAFAGSGEPIAYDVINVPAHHRIIKTIEVAKADKDLITASFVNGKAVVKNNSCYKDVTYYEVEYCVNDECDLDVKGPDTKKFSVVASTGSLEQKYLRKYTSTELTAKHDGNHSIEEALKAQLLSSKEDSKFVNSKGELTVGGLVLLANVKKAYAANRYVKVSDNTATCTESGTIVVTFICKQCEKDIETITFKTPKLGHDFTVMEDTKTRVPSTCEQRGHYETAKLCKRCGVEAEDSERVTVYTKRLPHTNEYSVSDSGVGQLKNANGIYIDKDAEIKFIGDKVVDINGENLAAFASGNKKYKKSVIVGSSVSAGVYTNCTVCHNNEVKIGDISSLTITGIQKENASGAAGKITLKATYTTNAGKTVTNEVTVPYFSSALAYAGRTEDEVLNGLHEDKDGVTRYYVDNKVSEVTGIIKYAGREYLVNKGVLCEDTHGVTLVGDTFYFLANGCVQRGFTGVTIYDGQSFYLNNGEVDTEINGLVPYDGGTFLFAAGRLVKEHNGLWQDFDGTWYFLALGKVQTQYTGVAEYDGACFYVKNGKLDTTKNGTITIDGVKYTAVDGQLYK